MSLVNRELDAKVAEKVMGWVRDEFAPHIFNTPNGGYRSLAESDFSGFEPFKDVRDDYLVLKHVRESWVFSKRKQFAVNLQRLISDRVKQSPIENLTIAWPDVALLYESGDYSKAALKALGEEV